MQHSDHVALISAGVPPDGGAWADLGSGDGAFTLALRDLAGPGVEIWAVDRNQGALESLRRRMDQHFPGANLQRVHADFTHALQLSMLDGILSANAIHFVDSSRQQTVLQSWRDLLRPGGRLVLVEYDADTGNRWVPHPLSFQRFIELAPASGYSEPTLIDAYPSRFFGSIYGAVAIRS